MAGSAVASKGPHVGSPSPRSLHPLQPHTVLPCIQCLQRAMPRILTISHCDLFVLILQKVMGWREVRTRILKSLEISSSVL